MEIEEETELRVGILCREKASGFPDTTSANKTREHVGGVEEEVLVVIIPMIFHSWDLAHVHTSVVPDYSSWDAQGPIIHPKFEHDA